MKRTFAKRSLMTLVTGFFLFGFMLFTAVRAEAQTPNWVTPDEAKDRLVQAVTTQHSILAGNPADTDAMMRATYFKGIFQRINDGMPVADAVQGAIASVTLKTESGGASVDDDSSLQSPLQGLIDEAIDLLTD